MSEVCRPDIDKLHLINVLTSEQENQLSELMGTSRKSIEHVNNHFAYSCLFKISTGITINKMIDTILMMYSITVMSCNKLVALMNLIVSVILNNIFKL